MANMLGGLLKSNIQEWTLLLLLGLLLEGIRGHKDQVLHSEVMIHKESGPVIMFPLAAGRSCNNSEECLKKLQTFLHLHSLPFATKEAEMDKLCNTTVEGYNCSSQLVSARDCLTKDEENVFKGFVQMAQDTFLMFCPSAPGKEGYLRQAMLESGECVLRLRSSLNCCAREAKLPDVPAMQIMDDVGKSLAERERAVCCPMANYLKCVAATVGQSCGPAAANFTVEYARRSAGEPVQGACQSQPSYPEPDTAYCNAPVPLCPGRSSASSPAAALVALLCLLVVLCN